MKPCLFALVVFLSCPALFGQTESCPSGTEDMLNYFTMAYPNRLQNHMGPGNANPIYTVFEGTDPGTSFTTTGEFFWLKSAQGYPWDIKTFDSSYVYDRATEANWNDPTSFKRFDTDLPMSKRCVSTRKSGGSIRVSSSSTNYSTYSNCAKTQTQNLGYVINSISAASVVDTGGNLGTVKTRYFTYSYSCDSSYKNCAYQEVYSLGYGVGLYDWKYYVNQNGTFVQTQESIINQFDSGSATPYLPCASSYQ